jgi:hypothetical protein
MLTKNLKGGEYNTGIYLVHIKVKRARVYIETFW